MNSRNLKIAGASLAVLLVFALGVAAGTQTTPAAAGAGASPASAQVSQDESEPGVVVVVVDREGPAAAADVKRGDILLTLDDEAIDSPRDLARALQQHKAGDPVTLVVMHGDERRTLTATLAERNGRPYLGLKAYGQPDPVFNVVAPAFRPMIVEVVPDSPAATAGLQEGDHIRSVDGQELSPEDDLAAIIAKHKPGDSITLEVEQPGEDPREVTVTLGEHPDRAGAAYLGVRYLPHPRVMMFGSGPAPFAPHFFPEGLPFEFPLPDVGSIDQNGLIVGEVADDSPAAAAGLHVGDVITAIDGEPVTTHSVEVLREAVAARHPGDTLRLSVLRDGESHELEATLAEHPDHKGKAYLGVTIMGFFGVRKFMGGETPDGFMRPDFRFRFHTPFHGFPFEPPAIPDEPPAEAPRSTTL